MSATNWTRKKCIGSLGNIVASWNKINGGTLYKKSVPNLKQLTELKKSAV